MSRSSRILVLVPHPDDEVVGCAIMGLRARLSGSRIFTLYLTTGVPAREVFWPWQRRGHDARVARRREEAMAAARLLGFEPIGFQDWPTRQLRFHFAEARARIETALSAYRIDALWTPAWEGAHQDHDAANVLASRFVALLPVSEFAEYHFADGAVHSQSFVAPLGGERTIELSPEEQAIKRQALALYRSERGNLRHIGSAVEAMRPLPAHDYAMPPHPGRLFWTRFHWVPFRHPRIDRDSPEAVRTMLARFAAEMPSAPLASRVRPTEAAY